MIQAGAAPGFQCALGIKDRSLGCYSVGRSQPPARTSVTAETFFDLASLTKVVGTVTFILWGLQLRKNLELTDPLSKFFPSFSSGLKDRTVKDLLLHRAGLPGIFETLEELPSREERIRFFLQRVDQEYTALSPQYSDVGFILLGLILEQVFGKRLREIAASYFGKSDIKYGPISGRKAAYSVSLEDSTEVLKGVVQDPRAEWLDGDAGHAGLFGTAEAIEKWAQQIFRAYHGKDTLLGDRVVRGLLNFEEDMRWVGGFDRPTPPSQAGELFSATTIGHLGYTGTSFWMDLETGARVTLLAHRYSPGFDPEILKKHRPEFHNWLWREVFSKI